MVGSIGQRIRLFREERCVSREELCGDETNLSVRQLARIESGQSVPTILTIQFIRDRLGVPVGSLLDGNIVELPKCYQELKYQMLRTPVYLDPKRIEEREEVFDRIYEEFYDKLPEEEQLIVETLQALFDVSISNNSGYGLSLLENYFDQVRSSSFYHMQELLLIELYLVCSSNTFLEGNENICDFCDQLLNHVQEHFDGYHLDELFIVNRILINVFGLFLPEEMVCCKQLEHILQLCELVMKKIQDFQRMPILKLMTWKYHLFLNNHLEIAEKYYLESIMFAKLNGDLYLERQLENEWQKDIGGYHGSMES